MAKKPKDTLLGVNKAIAALKATQLDILQAMQVCVERTAGEFLTNHFSGGKRYKPLTTAYKRQKDKKFGRKPILVASGELKQKATSNKAVSIAIDKSGVLLTVSVTDYGDFVLELRDYLTLTDREIDYLSQMIEEKLSQIQLVRQGKTS